MNPTSRAAPEPDHRPWHRSIIGAVVAFLVLALLPLAQLIADEPRTNTPGINVAEQVSKNAANVLTIRGDGKSAEQRRSRLLTETFAEAFRGEVLTAVPDRKDGAQLRTVTTVRDTGVIDAAPRRLIALVFADISVRPSNVKRSRAAEPAPVSLRVTANRVRNEWRIAKIERI